MSAGKILFFRIWSGPPIAASVETLLRDTFPEYDIQTITLWDRIKADKRLVLCNAIAVIAGYGWDILFRRLRFKTAFFRTTYLFKRIHSLAVEIGKQHAPVCFTFQLQSIFDTSITGVPNFVYTDHTHLANLYYTAHMRVRLFSAEWISCEKMIYDHARMIFTRSSNISQSLIEQYGVASEKVACVFVGPNTKITDVQPAQKDYAPKRILFVGLDWERKGGPDLLAAFEKVFEFHPDASLTVVGCHVVGSHPAVRSVGRVSVDRLRQYYKEATIFCMPSLVEPFGVVFVEAMAYALPIVGTTIGALPDMVQEGRNGFLVAPGDLDALAGALDRLLADQKLRERFGKESHLISANRYNWQSVGIMLRENIMKSLKERS